MTEQKSVSPLLDGFTIGTPVNDHFGVCCYPAVKENSERKYIVKVISIPASQTQLDALLITGAYKDPADAAEYFRTLSDNIVEEADFLKKMSHLEGFIPYEGCQVEPMQKNRIGYEVYLLSGFRLSLERYMHRHTVSHLETVNLGIDLCTALAACRRAGMLYIDLKPSNIFISTKKEYKIGDLGFAPLDSMKYSSMPEKYRSCYTAPELLDDLSVLNGTADTYAVGMILYQLFNNGALPQDRTAPLPAPANADEAMAAILQKACAPSPEDRWADPTEMGQALVNYMQAGTINDTPIMEPMYSVPVNENGELYQTAKFPVPTAEQLEAASQEAPAEQTEAQNEAAEEAAQEAPEVTEPEAAEPAPEEPAQAPAEEATAVETAPESVPVQEAPVEQPEAAPAEPEMSIDEIEAAAAAEFAALTGSTVTAEPEEQIPTLDGPQLDTELKELNQMLGSSKDKKKSDKKAVKKLEKKVEKTKANITPVVIKPEKKKKSAVRVLFTILIISLLFAGSVWGYMFYTSEYLQTVKGISITGTLDKMTVTVDSDVREGLLTVVAMDPYGNSFRQRVWNHKAEFSQLSPATFYTVSVEISGLHKLVNPVSDVYTTESVTSVASLNATAGSTDGSVTLNLIVEGHEPDQWQVFYTAEGQPELAKTFTGHTVTIDNLVLGLDYTFRLETGNREPVNGQSETQFTASKLVAAREVDVISCNGGELLVQWDNAGDFEPDFWRVRCIGDGYDETQEISGHLAVFSGIDSSKAYTVEVTAKGMVQTARVAITANPVTLTNLQIDDSNPEELRVSWDFEGTAPEGWLLQYTLDNSTLPNVVKAEGTTAVVAPRIPGAVYHFSVQSSSNVSIFNGLHTYSCPGAQVYSGHGVTGNNISCMTLPTPENDSWSYFNVPNSSFTNVFAPGQAISVVLSSNIGFYLDAGDLNVLFVFRDQSGSALAECIGEATVSWHDLWYKDDPHYGELNVPASPAAPGNYQLEIYFNGCSVTSANITIA